NFCCSYHDDDQLEHDALARLAASAHGVERAHLRSRNAPYGRSAAVRPCEPRLPDIRTGPDGAGCLLAAFPGERVLVGSPLVRFHPEPAYPRSVRVSRVVTGVIAVVCLLGIF